MESLVRNVREIFAQVQFTKTSHSKYSSKLKKTYQSADPDEFAEIFISCLLVPLSVGETHPHVENTLLFAAKFAVSVYSFDDATNEDRFCPFLTNLFDFLLTHHEVRDKGIRFRVCRFINMLLNSMGEDAFINDDLCDNISAKMMDRLMDISPKVRAQAVFALNRLQDPTIDSCPIIASFIYHLNKDPKPEVRRAIIMNIGRNKKTVQAVLQRTHDVSETVRKAAYQFFRKITPRSLTIKERNELLKHGLRDRSEPISKFVKNELLSAWLRSFDGDLVSFLRALDAENSAETSTMALNAFFKLVPLNNIIQQVPIDPDTKLIPVEKLTSENALYWRCVVEYLNREGCTEEMDKILPELQKFCTYIRDFIKNMKQVTYQDWETRMHNFILSELFEITRSYDLGDEIGRASLKELISDTLLSDNDTEVVIVCIVKRLESVIPDTNSRLTVLAEVISELRIPMRQEIVPISEADQHEKNMQRARLRVNLLEASEEQYDAAKRKDFLKAEMLKETIAQINREIAELSTEPVVMEVREENAKNDEKTMVKCLRIMCGMMQSVTVKSLTPTLRSLLTEMVIPSLDHPANSVVTLAIEATAICCLLDKDLAKKYIMIFFLLMCSEDNENIWLPTVKAIFDLLVRYGFEFLGLIPHEDPVNDAHNRSRKNKTVRLFSNTDEDTITNPRYSLDNANGNMINILTGLLDSSNQDLRTVAAEGLSRLLLLKQVNSASLVSRLLILWLNPVTEGDSYLRQCLCCFFSHFPVMVPESQEMLEQAFLPTLKILANAPDLSPLQEIDPNTITKLILDLTRPQNGNVESYCPHNSLAFTIIAEALNVDSEIEPEILIKSLNYLYVDVEDDACRKRLLEAVEKLLEKIGSADKRQLNCVAQFEKRLQRVSDVTQPPEVEVEPEENLDIEDDT